MSNNLRRLLQEAAHNPSADVLNLLARHLTRLGFPQQAMPTEDGKAIWRRRGGKALYVEDMSDGHLFNAMRMMEREAADQAANLLTDLGGQAPTAEQLLQENPRYQVLREEEIRRAQLEASKCNVMVASEESYRHHAGDPPLIIMTHPGPRTVYLDPDSPQGTEVLVKDGAGTAGEHPIMVTTEGRIPIEGTTFDAIVRENFGTGNLRREPGGWRFIRGMHTIDLVPPGVGWARVCREIP